MTRNWRLPSLPPRTVPEYSADYQWLMSDFLFFSRLLVGAPRGNRTSSAYPAPFGANRVIEPGVLYKCSLWSGQDACSEVVLDTTGKHPTILHQRFLSLLKTKIKIFNCTFKVKGNHHFKKSSNIFCSSSFLTITSNFISLSKLGNEFL